MVTSEFMSLNEFSPKRANIRESLMRIPDLLIITISISNVSAL